MTLTQRLILLCAALAILWLTGRLLGRQQRRHAASASGPASAKPRLLVVVSSRCSACTAQKHALAQLEQACGDAPLEIDFIDAEAEPDSARNLAIMTIPSTVLIAKDGTVTHINNGYAPLSLLLGQIRRLDTTGEKT